MFDNEGYQAKLKHAARNRGRFKATCAEVIFFDYVYRYVTKRMIAQMVLGAFTVDFAFPWKNLIVELDGGYHRSRRSSDKSRDKKLREYGFRVIRMNNYLTNVGNKYIIENKLNQYADSEENKKNFSLSTYKAMRDAFDIEHRSPWAARYVKLFVKEQNKAGDDISSKEV